MGEVTLRLYQAEERRLSMKQARHGYRIHALVTMVVVAGLAVMNVFVAPGFPWSAFAAGGMLIGLGIHWYFAIRRGDEFTRRHQEEVERAAQHRSAA